MTKTPEAALAVDQTDLRYNLLRRRFDAQLERLCRESLPTAAPSSSIPDVDYRPYFQTLFRHQARRKPADMRRPVCRLALDCIGVLRRYPCTGLLERSCRSGGRRVPPHLEARRRIISPPVRLLDP
jgi:hypothetical protein